jgi:hypothetical protein
MGMNQSSTIATNTATTKPLECNLYHLTTYELNERLRTYYYQWRDIKRDMSFFSSEEEDEEMFKKISELKANYKYVKDIIAIKAKETAKKLIRSYEQKK